MRRCTNPRLPYLTLNLCSKTHRYPVY